MTLDIQEQNYLISHSGNDEDLDFEEEGWRLNLESENVPVFMCKTKCQNCTFCLGANFCPLLAGRTAQLCRCRIFLLVAYGTQFCSGN